MLHLRSIQFHVDGSKQESRYPFHLPILQQLDTIQFQSPVTFFVGENGSGKSTVLEAIAAAVQAIAVGQSRVESEPDMESARELAKCMKLTWQVKTRKGFFLRAEDFIGYIRNISSMRTGLQEDLEEVEKQFSGRSKKALQLAKMPLANSLSGLQKYYGDGLDKRSHGEGFIDFFQSRLTPKGLYLLDEPETPLSPLKQLSFISMLKDMVAKDCQFIIATHSPILLAYPGATILSFDEVPVREVPYAELEHVKLTKDFLNHPEQFLRHL